MGIEDDLHGRRDTATRRSRSGLPPAWVGRDVVAVRESLWIDAEATPRTITDMRHAVAEWLALDVAPGDALDDVVLIAYEALANVVDHAYTSDTRSPDIPGRVRLTAHRGRDCVGLTVADDGRWRPAAQAPFRGHGLSVIRLLTDQVHVETSGRGTRLHVRCPLPDPIRPEPIGPASG